MPNYTLHTPSGSSYGPADEATLIDWAKQGRVPVDALLRAEGETAPPMPVRNHPTIGPFVIAPPIVAGKLVNHAETDSTGGLIPYKNPPALIGYYVAVASLIPIFTILLAPAAIILGIFGLLKVRRNPRARGTAHAIIAILLGLGTLVGYFILVYLYVISPVRSAAAGGVV